MGRGFQNKGARVAAQDCDLLVQLYNESVQIAPAKATIGTLLSFSAKVL